MKIKGNSSNNIQIGNTGSKNTINLVHNSHRADHTLLKLDENSIHEYDKKDLKRDNNIGLS